MKIALDVPHVKSKTPKWKPQASTTTEIHWLGVLSGSAWQAEPGMCYLSGSTHVYGRSVPIEIIEYRDAGGFLHGVVTWQQGSMLFIMVDPQRRRAGIATKLMQEATKRWAIDFRRQRYTRDGAKFFRTFLARESTTPGSTVQV